MYSPSATDELGCRSIWTVKEEGWASIGGLQFRNQVKLHLDYSSGALLINV